MGGSVAKVQWTVRGKAYSAKGQAKPPAPFTNEAVDSEIAHLKAMRVPLRQERERLLGIAKGIHAGHRDKGHSRIVRDRGGVDFYVALDDERGDQRAHAIEARLRILRRAIEARVLGV